MMRNLKDLCFNQDCGNIFYSYLLQINANKIDVSTPPETDLHKRMVMLSSPSWITFIKSFIDEQQEPVREILSSSLYLEYIGWCKDNGEKSTTSKKFGSMMIAYGLERKHKAVGSFYSLRKI